MKERITTAAILITIAVAAITFHAATRLLLVFLVFALINFELLSLVRSLSVRRKVVSVIAISTIPVFWLTYGNIGFLGGILFTLIYLLSAELVEIENSVHERISSDNIAIFSLAIVYTGALGSVPIVVAHRQPILVLFWYIGTIIAADTLAFFGGKLFGGPKLASRISPKKTISGAVCGIVGSIGFSVVFGAYYFPDKTLYVIAAYGLLIALLAILGDLTESMIKRAYGVKDMGSLLPGHGGVLDRVDALIFASPVLLLFS